MNTFMNNIQEKYRIFVVFTDKIAEKLIKKVNFGNKFNALVQFIHDSCFKARKCFDCLKRFNIICRSCM